MDPVVRVEVKKDTGDASLLVGIIAGAIVGAAFAWVWTGRPPRQLVVQPPLPFGAAASSENHKPESRS